MAGPSIHRINKNRGSTTQFLTAGALPEMQNAQADSKENTEQLTAEGLGGINKQLYEFVSTALQTNLSGILSSQTEEFKKLSREVYRSIVDIIEAKSEDGELAEMMLQNLDIYKETEGLSTKESEQQVTEIPSQEQPSTEAESIIVEAPTIVDKEIQQSQETIRQKQEIVSKEKQIVQNTSIVHDKEIEKSEVSTDVEVDASEAASQYTEDVDSAIVTANAHAELVNELRAKLRLALVYLRSQKIDIFKILASANEEAEAYVEKHDEIDADYEEEMRRRKSERKDFDKRLAKEAEWYKKTFNELDESKAAEEKKEGKNKNFKSSLIPNVAQKFTSSFKKSKKDQTSVTSKIVKSVSKVISKITRKPEPQQKKEVTEKAIALTKDKQVISSKPVSDKSESKDMVEKPKIQKGKSPIAKVIQKTKQKFRKSKLFSKLKPVDKRIKQYKKKGINKGKGLVGLIKKKLGISTAKKIKAKDITKEIEVPQVKAKKVKGKAKVSGWRKIALEWKQLSFEWRDTAHKWRDLYQKLKGEKEAENKKQDKPSVADSVKASVAKKISNVREKISNFGRKLVGKTKPKVKVITTKKVIAKTWIKRMSKKQLAQIRELSKEFRDIEPVLNQKEEPVKAFSLSRARRKVKMGIKGFFGKITGLFSRKKLEPGKKDDTSSKVSKKTIEAELDEPEKKKPLVVNLRLQLAKSERTKKETSKEKTKSKPQKGALASIKKKAEETTKRARQKITEKGKATGKKALGKFKKTAQKKWNKLKAKTKKLSKKISTKAKKFTKQVLNKTKKLGKKLSTKAKKLGKKVLGKAKKVGKKLLGKAKKLGKKALGKAKKLGKKLWKGAKKVGKKIFKGVKKFGKKLFKGAKKFGKKIFKGAKRIGKKLFRGAKKVFSKVSKVASKIAKGAKKAIGKGVEVAAKVGGAIVSAVGKGVQLLGTAATAIPYVGVVLGPLLKGLGMGISMAGKALKAAAKTLGKIASSVIGAIEKGLSAVSKATNRGGLKKSLGKMKGLTTGFFGGAASITGKIKGFFTSIGRAIKSWTSKWFFNSYSKEVSSATRSLRFKVPHIPFKFKARFGNSATRKRSLQYIRNIHRSAISMGTNIAQAGFTWVKTITQNLADSFAGIMSSIGQRIAVIGTVGFGGLLKSLLNWKVLLPLGIILFIVFRKKIIPWLKKKAIPIIKGIAKVGKAIYKGVVAVAQWVTGTGKGFFHWLFRQLNPGVKWTLAWILTKVVGGVIWISSKLLKLMLMAFPFLNPGPFLLGMAAGGFWGPAVGKMIYNGIKALIKGIFYVTVKLPLRLAIGAIIPKSFMGISIRERVLNWLGLGPDPGDTEPKELNKAIDELEQKTTTPVNQIMATGKGSDIVNPKLQAVGLPGISKLMKNFKKNARANADAVNAFTEFIKASVPHLTDRNHVAAFTTKFYGDETITKTLLSVFFFTDPITGHVLSIIPKGAIPGVVKQLQQTIIAVKDNPKKLVEANRDVLTYFEYMNEGRSRIVNKIIEAFQKKIDAIAKAKGSKAEKLASEFAQDMKNHSMAKDAITQFHADVAAKVAGKGTKGADEIKGRRDKTGGDMQHKNVKGMLAVSGVPDQKSMTKIQKAGGYAKAKEDTFDKNFNMSSPLAKTSLTTGGSSDGKGGLSDAYKKAEQARKKQEDWKRYEYNTKKLIALGKSEAEIKAMGYGRSYDEWSKKYDERKGIQEEKKTPTAKGGMPKSAAKSNVPGQKMIVPKIQLPKIKFTPVKETKVNIPGLTRDIKEGTEEHSLYKIGIAKKPVKGGFREDFMKRYDDAGAARKKNEAWKRYEYQTKKLVALGKSEAQIKAMGYGLSKEEWSKKYDARLKPEGADGEKSEESKGTDVVDTKIEEQKEDDASKKPAAEGEGESKKKPNYASGEIDEKKVLGNFEDSQLKLSKEIAALDIGVALGKPKIPKVITKDEKKDGKSEEKSPIGLLKPINPATLTDKPIHDDLSGSVDGELKVEGLKVDAPSEAEMLPKTALSEEALQQQGISMVSDVQWVSAQEAYAMEQRLLSNAKDIRDIISGLMIMTDNLDNAKSDLANRITQFKENPIGQVIQLPTTKQDGPVVFLDPDKDDYDPLPPMGDTKY